MKKALFILAAVILFATQANAQIRQPFQGSEYGFGMRPMRTSTLWIDAAIGQSDNFKDDLDSKLSFNADFRWNYIIHDFLSWDIVNFGMFHDRAAGQMDLQILTGPRFTLYLNGVTGLYAGAQAGIFQSLGKNAKCTIGTNFVAGVQLSPLISVGVNFLYNFGARSFLGIGVGFGF